MKYLSASLIVAAMMAPSLANADVLCENNDKTVKIRTFQLSEDTFGFEPIKVAAILKLGIQKLLYTGFEEKQPSRASNTDIYSLVDEMGGTIKFKKTTTITYDQCTRVSCDAIVKIVGALEVEGESYSLDCSTQTF